MPRAPPGGNEAGGELPGEHPGEEPVLGEEARSDAVTMSVLSQLVTGVEDSEAPPPATPVSCGRDAGFTSDSGWQDFRAEFPNRELTPPRVTGDEAALAAPGSQQTLLEPPLPDWLQAPFGAVRLMRPGQRAASIAAVAETQTVFHQPTLETPRGVPSASPEEVLPGLGTPEDDPGSPAPEGRISSLINALTSYCTRLTIGHGLDKREEQGDSVGEDKTVRQRSQSPVELPRLPFGVNDLAAHLFDSLGETRGVKSILWRVLASYPTSFEFH